MAEITYLMERDSGASTYFANAKGFFEARDSLVVPTTGTESTSLADVFKDLRVRAKEGEVFGVINLVSHAMTFSALQFPVSEEQRAADNGVITTDVLAAALPKAGTGGYPAILGPPAVTKSTTVCLYGCDIGRDAAFMAKFGQLFGPELTIYAPLRQAVFRHRGTTFEHLLARTWRVSFPRDIATSTNWPTTRTEFLAKALPKFTAAGGSAVEADIRAAAQTATAAMTSSSTYFTSESLRWRSNPAAVSETSAVLPSGTVDDTTVATTLKGTDFTKEPAPATTWVAHVAVLGQILEEPVAVTNTNQFRKTVISTQKAASTHPLLPPPALPLEEPPEDDMLYGTYRATVVNDTDPMGSGRLQVSVPAIGVNDVWAEASLPPIPRSLLTLPTVGATVWVEFEGGDETRPIWTGATWDSAADTLTALTLTADARITLRAPQVEVESATTTSSGLLKAETVVATSGIISPMYTPGAGNLQ